MHSNASLRLNLYAAVSVDMIAYGLRPVIFEYQFTQLLAETAHLPEYTVLDLTGEDIDGRKIDLRVNM